MKKGIGLLVLATLLWSGNYIAGRILADTMPSSLLNAVRWIVSAVLLWLLLTAKGRKLPLKQKWKEFSILGFVGMFLFSDLTYLGLQSQSAAQAGMISGIIPITIVLFGVVIIADRPSFRAWLGVGLSIIGVIILFSGRQQGHQTMFSVGALATLLAAFAWGLYTVLGKRYGKSMDPLTMTAGAAFYGAIPSTIAGLSSLRTGSVHMTPLAWGCVLYVSTAASVLAYVCWNIGVQKVGASRAAPFVNLLPVWTVILGVALLHEQLSPFQLIGGTITILGAVISNLPSAQKAGELPVQNRL